MVRCNFMVARDDVENAAQLFQDNMTSDESEAGDGNAHFILYRNRRSRPSELIKSFLVLKPPPNPGSYEQGYHPTVHFYRAPQDEGSWVKVSPGKLVPLESGIFVVGGQRPKPIPKTPSKDPERPEPYRSLEIIYFPWETFRGSSLPSGLAITVNNEAEVLVTRICARPCLLTRSDDARLGAIRIEDLETDLKNDEDKEKEIADLVGHPDPARILEIYEGFGSLKLLGEKIVERCNNHSAGAWAIAPGLMRGDGKAMTDADFERALEDAFREFVTVDGKPFQTTRHVRLPPLGSL
jgi:hypothetical protein